MKSVMVGLTRNGDTVEIALAIGVEDGVAAVSIPIPFAVALYDQIGMLLEGLGIEGEQEEVDLIPEEPENKVH